MFRSSFSIYSFICIFIYVISNTGSCILHYITVIYFSFVWSAFGFLSDERKLRSRELPSSHTVAYTHNANAEVRISLQMLSFA
jgi:hypothetical protein